MPSCVQDSAVVTEINDLIDANPRDSVFCFGKTGKSFQSNVMSKFMALCKLVSRSKGSMWFEYMAIQLALSCEQQNLGQNCPSVQCSGQGVGSTSSRIQNERAIHVMMTACIMAAPAYPLPWWIMRLYLDSGRLLTKIWQCLFLMKLQGGACTCQAISKVEPPKDHWDANIESAFWSLLCPVQRNWWKILAGWGTAIFCRGFTCSQLLQLCHCSHWGLAVCDMLHRLLRRGKKDFTLVPPCHCYRVVPKLKPDSLTCWGLL